MPKKTKTTCFRCGEPTTRSVSRQAPPKLTRFICLKKECWDAWYNLYEEVSK